MHYVKQAAITLAIVYIGFQIPGIGPLLRHAAQKPTA